MELVEQDLVQEAVAGDRLALDRLLAMHAVALAKHLQPRMPSSLSGVIDADDVLQQTFLQAYRDIRSFQPYHQGSFYAWLRGIADNRLLDCVRELKRKKRGGEFRRVQRPHDAASSLGDFLETLVSAKRSPSQSVAIHEAEAVLLAGIEVLPSDQREAIQRHCLEGQSLQEVADAMGRTSGAVRALVHRGKRRLQEDIDHSAVWCQE